MADEFDSTMNNTCSILGRVSGAVDAAGLTPRTTAVLQANVPCRIYDQKPADEEVGQKEFSILDRFVAMRPWAISGSTVSSPRSIAEASGKTLLNTDMLILCDGVTYNIRGVKNWSGMYHHFTAVVRRVEA